MHDLLLALGLASDAAAVALLLGALNAPPRPMDARRVASWFGAFQAALALVGWFAGSRVGRAIEILDHWVAFGILFALGIKFLHEGLTARPPRLPLDALKTPVLCVLAVATSIDALAAGFSIGIQEGPILRPVLLIGAVAFGLPFFAYLVGSRVGRRSSRALPIMGGLILMAIGAQILWEHLGSG
jgi:putative Mn2+ efflux pump MntP